MKAVTATRKTYVSLNRKLPPNFTFPGIISLVASIFKKHDIPSWVFGPIKNLFTWNDYFHAYIIRENTQNAQGSSSMILFMTAVSCFYWLVNQKNSPTIDPTIQSFLSHVPYDYSRPNDWYAHNNYVSYAEALHAVIQMETSGTKPELIQIISIFKSQFPSQHFSSSITTIQHMKIPFQLYSSCFDSVQPGSTKSNPYDLEICVYYALQNNLDPKYIWMQKATKDQAPGKTSRPISTKEETSVALYITMLPSLKWFNVFEWTRLLTFNLTMTLLNTNYNHPLDYAFIWHQKAKTVYNYRTSSVHKYGGLGYQGIAIVEPFQQFSSNLLSFYSFGGFPVYIYAEATLLKAQVEASLQHWENTPFSATQTSADIQSVTLAYKTALYPAYKKLGLYGLILTKWKKNPPKKLGWHWANNEWTERASKTLYEIIDNFPFSETVVQATKAFKTLTIANIPLPPVKTASSKTNKIPTPEDFIVGMAQNFGDQLGNLLIGQLVNKFLEANGLSITKALKSLRSTIRGFFQGVRGGQVNNVQSIESTEKVAEDLERSDPEGAAELRSTIPNEPTEAGDPANPDVEDPDLGELGDADGADLGNFI